MKRTMVVVLERSIAIKYAIMKKSEQRQLRVRIINCIMAALPSLNFVWYYGMLSYIQLGGKKTHTLV